jgi:hypothetical protein
MNENPLFTPSNPRIGAIYLPRQSASPIHQDEVRKGKPTGELIAKGRYGTVEKYGFINPATSARINPVSRETFAKSEGMGGAKKKAAKKTTKQTKAKTTTKKAKK